MSLSPSSPSRIIIQPRGALLVSSSSRGNWPNPSSHWASTTTASHHRRHRHLHTSPQPHRHLNSIRRFASFNPRMPFWLATLGFLCVRPCIQIGPDFWGLMHKHWRMCKTGKLQSPINIDPEKLVFDPGLGKLAISKNQIDADLWNTGQFPLLNINASASSAASSVGPLSLSSSSSSSQSNSVIISGGPAYPYNYQFQQLLFHFGDLKKGERGSEHTIDRVRFPAEVQLLAYNSDLYENFTQALSQPRGLLAIGLIVDIGDKTNAELKRLTHAAPSIKHRNQMVRVRNFQPAALLPSTDYFVTYEGSLTFPGCFETVTWVLFNSPIYMTTENLAVWTELVQSEKPTEKMATAAPKDATPPVPLSSNYRPLKSNNGRLIRTNINVKLKPPVDGNCPSNVYVDMGYKTNPKREQKRLQQQQKKSANSREQHEQQQQQKEQYHKYKIGT